MIAVMFFTEIKLCEVGSPTLGAESCVRLPSANHCVAAFRHDKEGYQAQPSICRVLGNPAVLSQDYLQPC